MNKKWFDRKYREIFDLILIIYYNIFTNLYFNFIIMFNKKQILIFLVLLLAFGTTYATETSTWEVNLNTPVMENSKVVVSITWVDVVDSKTLSVWLSSSFNWVSLDSEAKVLEDIKVISSTKDLDNTKKITLELDSDLIDGNNYSIISVSEWLDTSIDFNLSGDKLNILNTALDLNKTWIEHISIIGNKIVEIYLNKETTLNTFEFKVFKEIPSESMFLDTLNLNIKLSNTLNENKEYILILNLKDIENNDVEIENSIFNFTTWIFEVVKIQEETLTGELLAAPEENSLSWSQKITQTGETIETVAMSVTQTPDTWAKTNFLLFLTFILTLTLIFLRKKELKI